MVTTKRTAALTQSVISLLSHFHTSLSTLVFTKVHKYYAIAQHTPQKTALEQKKKKVSLEHLHEIRCGSFIFAQHPNRCHINTKFQIPLWSANTGRNFCGL